MGRTLERWVGGWVSGWVIYGLLILKKHLLAWRPLVPRVLQGKWSPRLSIHQSQGMVMTFWVLYFILCFIFFINLNYSF